MVSVATDQQPGRWTNLKPGKEQEAVSRSQNMKDSLDNFSEMGNTLKVGTFTEHYLSMYVCVEVLMRGRQPLL